MRAGVNTKSTQIQFVKIRGIRIKGSTIRVIRGLSFQNRRRRRVIGRVAQADKQSFRAAGLEQFFPLAVQDHERLAGFLAPDFHVLPAELRADAGAERLGNGLLGRESHGQERRGILVRETVGDFVRVQDAVHEPLAEFFVRRRDARHFDDVNANAENHGIYDSRFAIDAQANLKQCFDMAKVMNVAVGKGRLRENSDK